MLIVAGLMLALGSYMSLLMLNLKASHRTAHLVSAMNIAESGLEEGMWSINQQRAGSAAAYTGWTTNDSVTPKIATRTFTNFSAGTTVASSTVTVQISNYDLSATTPPTIKAHAVLGLGDNNTIEKWVEVVLNAPSHAVTGSNVPPFPGLVAKNAITFKGNNASVDSWNSDPDLDASTPAVQYSASVRHDKGFVGSLAVAVDQVSVQNADVFGFVSTYQDTDLSNNVGPNGSILASDSPAGTKIDSRRVSTDFVATLPDASSPTNSPCVLASINSATSLPRAGDTPATDGKYYYQASGISLQGSAKNPQNLNITSSDVVLIVPGPYSISISGNAGLNITNGASLAIYAGGDVSLTGNGVMNGSTTTPQQPIKFQVWGTAATPSGQSIKIAGNGVLSGVVYAPNAAVTIDGNGDVLGSIVGNTITLTGNAAFHYDESLGSPSFGKPEDTGQAALRIALWRELLDPSEKTFL